MGEPGDEHAEHPATWENVVVGKVKKLVGGVLGKEELVDEGADQEEIAYEVHDEVVPAEDLPEDVVVDGAADEAAAEVPPEAHDGDLDEPQDEGRP